MSKSAPAAPDYGAAAAAQADSSREVTEQQTWANRPTINTPFGQQSWSVTPTWDPSTGQYLNTWTQNTNLTPEAQQALDSQLELQQGRSDLAGSLLGRAQDEYGQPMDWSQFTQLSGGPQAHDYTQNGSPNVPNYSPEQIQRNLDTSNLQGVNSADKYYNQAGDAIFNQWQARNEPQFTKDTDALRTQLYNQGLKEGDAAYDDAMRKLQQNQNDARQQASYQATIGAGSEASRMQGMDLGLRGQQFNEAQAGGAFANSAAAQALQQQLGIGSQQYNQQLSNAQLGDTRQQNTFNEGMTASNYQNQLRQQQIAEEMQRRGFSLNEINAILSGQQVGMPSMPNFNTAAASQPVNYSGAAQQQGQHDLDVFNAQQAATQGLLSGVGGAAMMFSDRRLKRNIVQIGKFRGSNLYLWDWVWGGSGVGVMADEVPHAVAGEIAGFKVVDYGRL